MEQLESTRSITTELEVTIAAPPRPLNSLHSRLERSGLCCVYVFTTMRFRENIALSEFSHYKIGGRARFFFEPKNEKEITWAVGEAKAQKLPIFVLGGGTNLLLSDDGFDGLVIKPNLTILRSQGTRIEAGAGVPMAKLLTYAMGKSLSGLEWAGGLPGTLGGAIRGNAGCFGGEIKDVVASVRSFDIKKMRFVTRNAKACAFGYRDSIFKSNKQWIILSATLEMEAGDPALSELIPPQKKRRGLEPRRSESARSLAA